MVKKIKILIIFVCIFILTGCLETLQKKQGDTIPEFKAYYTKTPISVDGKLDEDVWKAAPSYELNLSKDKTDAGNVLKEGGKVQFAWDENYFYLAATFEDSAVIAEGKEDEMHHYQFGDLCELFLKPADSDHYWELYVTPFSKKSSFFMPSRKYVGSPGCLDNYICGLKVASNLGSAWTAEMAMPIKDLQAFKNKFEPGQDWRVFVGRYNYPGKLENPELSMAPQLSATNYHLINEYGILKILENNQAQ